VKRSQQPNAKTKAQKLPWYAEGLRFSCLRCGDCCRGEPGFVWIRRDEINAAAEFLKIPAAEFNARYIRKAYGRLSLVELDNGDCIFWSDEGCKIYPVRPTQCLTFPFWPEYLRSSYAWGRVQRRCPAIGAGKLHTLEQIKEKLSRHRNE